MDAGEESGGTAAVEAAAAAVAAENDADGSCCDRDSGHAQRCAQSRRAVLCP